MTRLSAVAALAAFAAITPAATHAEEAHPAPTAAPAKADPAEHKAEAHGPAAGHPPSAHGSAAAYSSRNTFGNVGSGATQEGTAGGGTRTTYSGAFDSGSYGVPKNKKVAGGHGHGGAHGEAAAEPVPAGSAPIRGVGFSTAPGVATTSSTGALASAAPASVVRDHSAPASADSPANGGEERVNSVPTAGGIPPVLPAYKEVKTKKTDAGHGAEAHAGH